jgi:serine/threonine protein kinase/tetratricopeptide (TPR) repeat protein
LIGQTLAHYRVTAAIGAGGMGEVYRATDTKLGREVALKVLPAEMAANPERLERFQREAKALAALDHPGIVTVYSVEESGGVHFLTMQLVEGQPLDRVIPEEGLPVDRLLEIGTALTDALAAAHEKGIVHRDLKPGNVMVTDAGRVKVLDFGLAKVAATTSPEESSSELLTEVQTREGVVMGTVPYMSPEQVAGRTVDHRSDIFSLGVILHEMATGGRPFEGQSSAELASAILRDVPPRVDEHRPDLPEALVRVVARCLEKDADRRPKNARDVRDLLEAARTGAALDMDALGGAEAASLPSVGARHSTELGIAVLSISHPEDDRRLSALADGLTEDIATGLGRCSYLTVAERAFAGETPAEPTALGATAQRLGVRYLVVGSLRGVGDAIRLNVRVVDAIQGRQVWSETFDRDLSEQGLFEAQDTLTGPIVATIGDNHGVVVRAMCALLREKDPNELTAADWILRLFEYYRNLSPQLHAVVRDGLERAAEHEPNRADVHAALGQAYVDEYRFAFNPRPEPLRRAMEAARRALSLDTTNQMAHLALAQAHFHGKDLTGFWPHAERALELNRYDSTSAALLGILIGHSGDWERGGRILREAMALHPHHPSWCYIGLFLEAYKKRDYEAALAALRRTTLSDLFWAHVARAAVCAQLGRMDEAEAAVRELLRLVPDFAERAYELFDVWHYDSDLVEHQVDGLEKAGLTIARRPGHGRRGRAADE